MNVSYEVVKNLGVIPIIEMIERDFRKVYDILIDNVFNEGGKGYFTNKKHLVMFNDNLMFCHAHS